MARIEDSYVKLPALAHATRLGWRYMSIKKARPDVDYDADTNIFLQPFADALRRLNPDVAAELDDERARFVVAKIKTMLGGDDLGRAFLNALRDGLDGLRLVDFDHPERNDLTVVTELTYANGDDNFRPDITFLINGMPLAFMEVKRPNNREGIIAERDRMHARFRQRHFRRFVNITQVMAFSNDQPYDDSEREPIQGSFYATGAYGHVWMNHFREEGDGEADAAGATPQSASPTVPLNRGAGKRGDAASSVAPGGAADATSPVVLSGARQRGAEGPLAPLAPLAAPAPRSIAEEKRILKDNSLIALHGTPEWELSVEPDTPANAIITSLFSPGRLLFLLRYGICHKEYTTEDGRHVIEKHIMRYPQLFATKAVARRLGEGVQQGVIWHTQGSGKTELAFLLSRYLRDYYGARNKVLYPFFIVDRLDLANQAADEFAARGAQVLRADSREGFVKLLQERDRWAVAKAVDGQGANPVRIAVVNIQKFSEDAQAIAADYDLHDQRLFFIDEAHREYKPGKSFLSALFNADRDAVRIALTGTPLINQKGGANTRQVFGDYIHTYFYDKSIKDGYTLRLLREDIKTEYRVRMRSILDDLQAVDQRLDRDKNLAFEHPNFVEPLVEYIVNDLQRSRLMLGEGLPSRGGVAESRAVHAAGQRHAVAGPRAGEDDEEKPPIGAMIVARTSGQARAIYAELQRYDPDFSSALILHDEGTKESRLDDQRAFKRGGIDILVVFNMLLTGFDAPRLKKMYLCRRLDKHNLLQALTRVNRPYGDMEHGFVVDFADIREQFDKANQDYLRELNEEYGSATEQYESLFDDPKQIEVDLGQIKETLFAYSTDNEVAFRREIDAIGDDNVQELYALRKALERYKELRNLVTLYDGYEGLADLFDSDDLGANRFQKLLREVNLRIDRVNQRKALEGKELTINNLNLLLANMEYTFVKTGEEELTMAGQLREAVIRCGGSFTGSRDPKDPEFVNLLEKMRKLFRKSNMEESDEPLSSEEMTSLIAEANRLRGEVDELNRRDDQLANKYDGDDKFMRLHKWMRNSEHPIVEGDVAIFRMLNASKQAVDSMVEANAAALDQEGAFTRSLGPIVIKAAEETGAHCTAAQVKAVAGEIYDEYADERKHHIR